MEEELHVRLTYVEGTSNKEYNLDLVPEGDGWVVNFSFGRIGSRLNTGGKTPGPTTYAKARAVFDQYVLEKTRKGYKEDGNSPSSSSYQPPAAKEDTGLRPQLLNPITRDQAGDFITDDQWCMQPKYDGHRIFIVFSPAGVYGANRRGEKVSLPEAVAKEAQSLGALRAAVNANLGVSFTLDGELIGEMYYAFDVVERDGRDLRSEWYRRRLDILRTLVPPPAVGVLRSIEIAWTAVKSPAKRKMMELLIASNAEGVVFKQLDALYTAGRLPTQVKCKFWESASFVVLAVNDRDSIKIGLYDRQGNLKPWGNCTIIGHDNPKVGAVVEIKYLYAVDSIYQPIYKGVRSDIDPLSCTESQLKFKPKNGNGNGK